MTLAHVTTQLIGRTDEELTKTGKGQAEGQAPSARGEAPV